MSTNIRASAVAGMFYPSEPDQLRQMIRRFLDQAGSSKPDTPPKALIVPHAGYIYSGPVAAKGYALLSGELITRVVLLGPSHRVWFNGLAAPEARAWQTPLGCVPIDTEALQEAAGLPTVLFSDQAHAAEHSLEVQLPFLQEKLNAFHLTPFAVGEAGPEEIAEVLEALWGGPETLIVISSDLSHYEPYDRAVEKDAAAAAAILNLNVSGLDSDAACGLKPIAGLVRLARKKNLRVEQVDLRNSGDTAGPKDQVVGYGAFAFYE